MKKNFFAVLIYFILTPLATSTHANGPGEDKFDRLDGRGESGKRVDVIEWEGNLEIHVYPKGSLKGLALKIDKKNKDKPVMVIGYRFNNAPQKQLIRRAILGINLLESFKTFKDEKEPDFDKIVISNNGLALAEYKLDPAPTQLYPDELINDQKKAREVAGNGKQHNAPQPSAPIYKEAVKEITAPAAQKGNTFEEGVIKPFQW